ncbi:MAG: AbrB/MazE/SpoVT family DNA-binding domain-containing protein [bacterium]|jgi:bifunctional DNA-binding transcriptional regulator/antitoxin component of YhaV-PrlF toxin-antitoxin module
MVLIRRYRIRKQGYRGFHLTIPKEYIEDAKIEENQKMAIYRDGDKLVLVPEREASHD